MNTSFQRFRRGALSSRLGAWITGLGSVLDLSAGASTLLDRPESDWTLLGQDWQAVGVDCRKAVGEATKEEQAPEGHQLSLPL